jgi:hypothetical protein
MISPSTKTTERKGEPAGSQCTTPAGAPPKAPAGNAVPGSARCKDCDADCLEVENKLCCWAYQPERGWCPFLTQDN